MESLLLSNQFKRYSLTLVPKAIREMVLTCYRANPVERACDGHLPEFGAAPHSHGMFGTPCTAVL